MKISVNLENVRTVEFGIGIDSEHDRDYTLIPVDKSVQKVLVEMVNSTIKSFNHYR